SRNEAAGLPEGEAEGGRVDIARKLGGARPMRKSGGPRRRARGRGARRREAAQDRVECWFQFIQQTFRVTKPPPAMAQVNVYATRKIRLRHTLAEQQIR